MIKHILIVIFVFISTVGFAEDLTLTGNLSSDGHYIDGTISTQGVTIVNSGIDLELVAKNAIVLNSGFHVMIGGTLNASISPDTDGDQVLDALENRSSCLDYQLQDTDSDGLLDGEEDINRNGIFEQALNETNPCSTDTDGDKMDDKWEVDNGLNPLAGDADEDPDGDNLSNYWEYVFNESDPMDGNSLPLKRRYYEYDESGRVIKIINID